MYETLSDSLRFSRMSARLLNVEQAAFKTCQWIFQHDTYRRWIDDSQLDDHHGFMWIKGKPGSGKSTIMKLLHDSTAFKNRDHITIAYFFNGRASGDLEKSSLGLLRYLVSQILKSLPSVRDQFLTRFEAKLFKSVVEEWTLTELKGFLSDALCANERPPVNIFIDALDEGHLDDVRQLIAYLEQLTVRAIANSIRLRVCLSSRHYPHITIRKGLPLMLDEEDEHNQDVRTFVHTTLDRQAETLLEEICVRAAGVFLWVVLVVPRLNAKMDEGADLAAARALLQKLPTDLDALFVGILGRDTEDIDQCVELLQWVSFAQTALSPNELYKALQFASGHSTTHERLDREQLRRFFLHRSRGLLEITRDGYPVVQFIHETVRTFLLTPHGLPRIRPVLAGNVAGLSHEMLKQFCLKFIIQNQYYYEDWLLRLGRMDGFVQTLVDEYDMRRSKSARFENMFQPIGLYEYAVCYIFRHTENAELHGISQQGSLKVLEEKKILTILCHCLLRYRSIRGSNSQLSAMCACENDSNTTPTSEHNLDQLIRCMVGIGKKHQPFNSGIIVACTLQNAEIARLIVGGGLKRNHGLVTEIKKYGCFSLVGVTRLLHETIRLAGIDEIKVLLAVGVSIDAIDHNPFGLGTALQAAAYRGNWGLVDFLIEAGADVNIEAGRYGTALQAAAWSSDATVEIVELLLKHGASIDARGGIYGSALHIASVWASFEGTLNESVAPKLRRSWPLNPSRLTADGASGMVAKVKALLRRGATTTSEDWREAGLIQAYHELFDSATQTKRSHLINILLNVATEDKGTDGKATHALWGAALYGNSLLINMLLEYGAKPPSKGIHIRSGDYAPLVWDRFGEQRQYLTSCFDWLTFHDDGHYKVD